MHSEDLLIDDGGNGQAVEAVGERLPQLDVVATLALVVEAVDAVDGRALVVAAQDEEVFRVLDLVREEQANGLERLLATVHVVAEEEIVSLGREAAILEKAEQVVILSMDVTTDLRGRRIVSKSDTEELEPGNRSRDTGGAEGVATSGGVSP